MKYEPQKIERKWREEWEKSKMYEARDKVKGKENFYHMVMFPYPSGDLHIGHWYNFAPADVYARFMRMKGFNVMSPIGFDAFGLPAENAAIKKGIHPQEWTKKNIKKMRRQLRSIGAVYDWSREIVTCEPEYYKWTQWIFLQLYKKGLAYKAKVPANFCPSCKTVLANEQVVAGKCERCSSEVVQKEIAQWMLKISGYAEGLLSGLDKLDWPEATKIMQRNWIGKSEGYNIKFQISNFKFQIEVFTTRVDTLFGCTYLVVAPEHPILQNPEFKIQNQKSVQEYVKNSKKKTERDRVSEFGEKTGIELKGIIAINPVNGRKMPIFTADYVLMHYGTGAIMAVPAHDQRDFVFAKSRNLPIIEVIRPAVFPKPLIKRAPLVVSGELKEGAYEGEGFLINSERFDGIKSQDARQRIGNWLGAQKKAEKKIYYRIRDWIISRQRYWGAPIPIIFCQNCAHQTGGQGWQAVDEKDLPVLLPPLKDFRPSGEGKSPLAKVKDFVNVSCPKCGGKAERETDTMDTFICSSWYFLRYADPRNEEKFAEKEKLKDWLPVNIYIGGAEHSVLHLLYSRFFTKALNDLGHLEFDEPFSCLRHQGIILGPDGQKMSKSRGNVVGPDQQVKKYGADAVRMYLCFMGPYSQGGPWQPQGLVGIYRFLCRTWALFQNKKEGNDSEEIKKTLHKTVKKVSDDLAALKFNTAVSSLMVLVNELTQNQTVSKKTYQTLLKIMAPFAPHFAEELWQKFYEGESVHSQVWPVYDQKLVEDENVRIIIQINGKVRDRIEATAGSTEEEVRGLAFSSQKVQNWLGGKTPKKIIFVPDKIINIVI